MSSQGLASATWNMPYALRSCAPLSQNDATTIERSDALHNEAACGTNGSTSATLDWLQDRTPQRCGGMSINGANTAGKIAASMAEVHMQVLKKQIKSNTPF